MLTYAVKCDDCKQEIKRTNSMRESAEGGLCQSCETIHQINRWDRKLQEKGRAG